MENTRNKTQPDCAALPNGAQLPGSALAAARHARGMTLEDVARRLRLTPSQVRALEADDHAYFSAAVFARGYMRSYARLLDMDIDALLPPKVVTLPQAQPAMRLRNREPGVPLEARRSRHVPAMIAASVLLLAGLTYYEFVVNAPPGQPQSASISPSMTSPAQTERPSLPMAMDQPSTPVVAMPASLPRPLETTDGNLRLKPSIDPMSGANAKGLHFMFNNESWVEVRDAVGKIVYSRLNAPGSESIVQGVPPFSIVIGGASGVQLSYNGSRVDIASYVSEDVARLRLE